VRIDYKKYNKIIFIVQLKNIDRIAG